MTTPIPVGRRLALNSDADIEIESDVLQAQCDGRIKSFKIE